MRRRVFLSLLVTALLVLPLLASCKEIETTPTPTTTKPTATPTATTAAPTNWWDKLGEPQYGGTITITTLPLMMGSFDNYSPGQAEKQYWLETLWSPLDWTLDRQTWPYLTGFTPEKYCVCNLLESWEWTDPTTLTVHVRQGVRWQEKPPVNGREFTASDIQAHYDRIMGTGGGFTEPAPAYPMTMPARLEKVTATDKFTAVFKFTEPCGYALSSLMDPNALNAIEAPEWVEQGDLQNWKNAVGTGPWILTDYLDNTSMTLTRNPNYWNYDERHPENQLPYADELKILLISDISTRLAALRTGKIDITTDVDWQQAASIAETTPELIQVKVPPQGATTCVGLRNDRAPFTDIRVRKALQLSLDLEAIAKGYFGGTVDGTPCGLISPKFNGYAFTYENWPQALKDEYSYNPGLARELLADAGYPNGFDTNIIAATGMYDQGLMEAIKAYFFDIGVDMEIIPMDPPAQAAFINAGKHDQMVAWWSALSTLIPVRLITRYQSNNSFNWNHVNEPDYDKLIVEFENATDLDEMARIAAAADRYALEKHFVVNLFETTAYTIYQPYLKGYSGEARLGWGGTYLYARLWVDQDLKASMR